MMRGHRLDDAEQKALSTITNPDGGYLTSADMTGRIIARVRDMSQCVNMPMLKLLVKVA